MSAGRAVDKSAGDRSGRVDAVDCARGLALIGMAVYHLSWDLADFRLVSPLLPFTPPMRLLSHSVASVFLALVGVSLALAHRDGLNLRAFLRRLAIIGAAAALVTVASLVFAPGEGIFFGILHCIAAASLLAAPFVTAPAWASLAVGLGGDRRAVLRPLDAVRSALAFVARARRSVAEHARLAPAPALGRRRLLRPRRRAGARRPCETDLAQALARGVGAVARGVLRRPAQPADLSRASANPDRDRLCAHGLGRRSRRSLTTAPSLAACQRACVAKGRAAAECESACQCVADAIEGSGEADRLARWTPCSRAELKRLADACMGR